MTKETQAKTNKKTSKPSKEIVLAGATEIYQSNRITNGRFSGFTLIQSKLLISVIKQLQDAVKKSMSGQDYTQLPLFKENEKSSSIMIGIALSEIANPKQYAEVFEAATRLMDLKVNLKSPLGKEYLSIASLVSRIEKPVRTNGKSMLYLHMDKDIAAKLIQIDRNNNGVPIHYTKYLYEVALAAKNKYAYKLYWLISSWKTKGGFYITLNELRANLGIAENEYLAFAQLKRRILEPVQKELENKADCWFNCSAPDFEKKDGKKVIGLYFKVITPVFTEHLLAKKHHIQGLLREHFEFTESHMKRLELMFSKSFSLERYEKILIKITDVKKHITDVRGSDQQVQDIASYTLTSIMNLFPDTAG